MPVDLRFYLSIVLHNNYKALSYCVLRFSVSGPVVRRQEPGL
jgi:hypothetical protein